MTKITEEEQSEILRAKTECIIDEPINWFEMGYFHQYFKAFTDECKVMNPRISELLGSSSTFVYNVASFHRNMSQKQLVKLANILQLNDAERIKLYEQVGGVKS